VPSAHRYFAEATLLRLAAVALAIFAFVAPALGQAEQNNGKFELYGGYVLERIAPCGTKAGNCGVESGDLTPASTFNGWNAAVTAYFSKNVGVTAEFTGTYGTLPTFPKPTSSRYTFLFGPTARLTQSEKYAVAIHGLLGGVTQSAVLTYPFAVTVGGNLDVKTSKRISVRLVQFDYELGTFNKSGWTGGFRYSGGIVFH